MEDATAKAGVVNISKPTYDGHKAATAKRSRAESALGRDIGELPEIADPARRLACQTNLRLYLETYFPKKFYLPWSKDHLEVIARIEEVVLKGGLYAYAMQRGGGKTSLAEHGSLWAGTNGHRQFPVVIGGTETAAGEILDSVKQALDEEGPLADDYPDVCHAIKALDGIAHRANGQLYLGNRTHIGWTAGEIVLPTIRLPQTAEWAPFTRADGLSFASGVIVRVTGITGRIRGMKFARPDGQTVRPDLVLLDDPQTDESARSLAQCALRERTIAGAVLGLAGPGKKIAALLMCTVIAPDDLADRLLNRDKHPDWNGQRKRMVYAFPKAEKVWAQYNEIRGDSLRMWGDIRDATAFYLAHRAEMDEGAEVAWAELFNHDEASALQHAMNLKFRDEAAFFAEYQNDPLPLQAYERLLKPADVMARVNGRERGQVPQACQWMTGFVDVHDELLYWGVCAWQPDFSGFLVDYGVFPDQGQAYFQKGNPPRPMGALYRGTGKDGAIQAGLTQLVTDLLTREWPRAGIGVVRIDRLLVDMGYKPELVAAVKHKCGGATMVLSKGMGFRAGSKPIAMFERRPGWTLGHHWYIPMVTGTLDFPHVAVDVNYWKSFVHGHLAIAPGDPGALTIFGDRGDRHALFADHVAASEDFVVTQGHGRTVQEWRQRPNRPDNDWFDVLVGCTAAASMLGARVPGSAQPGVERKVYTQADFRRK